MLLPLLLYTVGKETNHVDAAVVFCFVLPCLLLHWHDFGLFLRLLSELQNLVWQIIAKPFDISV